MPKKKKDDLAAFQEWMMKEQEIGRRTASVYASQVRKILAALPHITTGLLDEYLRGLPSKTATDNAYTAWRRFVAYAQPIRVPMPTERSRRAKEYTYDIPPLILQCLIDIRKECRFPMEAFELLRHSDCNKIRRSSFYDITHPEEHWNTYRVSARLVDPIIKWGDPLQDHPDMPFIPTEPMGYKPVPTPHLKKMIRAYKRNPSGGFPS